MKIALVNTLYEPYAIGGAEKSVQALAEHLVKEGHEAVVLCCGPEAGTKTRTTNGVRVYELGLKNLYWPFSEQTQTLKPLWHAVDTYNPAMAAAAREVLERERPDVVHTNNLAGFSVALWRAVKALGLPIVHTLRDYYLLCPKTSMFRNGENCRTQCFDCRVYSLARQYASKRVDYVVGNSAFILGKHLAHGYFGEAKGERVIANGFARPGPLLEKDAPTGRLRLGYLGRLSEAKGVAYCLRLLRERFADEVEVYLAGRGEPGYEAALREVWPSANVHYLGFTAPASLFAAIDVLLAPSLWHEPLPRTAFEAYAHGIPVIGSNRGGVPELIEEGVTGFSFEPDEPESFVRAVSRFLNDLTLATKMRGACLEKARAFLPAPITEAYLEVYHSALERVG